MSDTKLAANISLPSIMEDDMPPSSPLSPEQERQEEVEEDEGEEENVAIYVWAFGPCWQPMILLVEFALGKMKKMWFTFNIKIQTKRLFGGVGEASEQYDQECDLKGFKRHFSFLVDFKLVLHSQCKRDKINYTQSSQCAYEMCSMFECDAGWYYSPTMHCTKEIQMEGTELEEI